MIDMGLEPFNVAAALNLVTAQRLCRRICSNCKEEAKYTDEYFDSARIPVEQRGMTFYKGKGCENCNGTGYRGRQGLYEVMAASNALRRLIMTGAGVDEIRQQALEDGMLTLRMDGLKKVEKGITTLEEVIKETSAQ
jgi:type IV pilus assembly protein PilB